jgi:hypothetical protein
MRPLRAVATTCVAAASLSLGCSDLGEPITLNSSEAFLLYQEINVIFLQAHLDRMSLGLSVTARGALPRGGMSLSELTTLHGFVNCAGGGRVLIDGNDTSTEQRQQFDLNVTYQACVTTDFELDGPYHQIVQAPTLMSSTTTGTGDLDVSVRADGRSGTCHLDFTYTVEATTVTATGTICGVAMAGPLQ